MSDTQKTSEPASKLFCLKCGQKVCYHGTPPKRLGKCPKCGALIPIVPLFSAGPTSSSRVVASGAQLADARTGQGALPAPVVPMPPPPGTSSLIPSSPVLSSPRAGEPSPALGLTQSPGRGAATLRRNSSSRPLGEDRQGADATSVFRVGHAAISEQERTAFAWAHPPIRPRFRRAWIGYFVAVLLWFVVVGPCVLISWGATIHEPREAGTVVPGLLVSGLLFLVFLAFAVVRTKWTKEWNEREIARYSDDYQRFMHRVRCLTLDRVDSMTGTEFEFYVARLAMHYGYSAEHVGGAGDQGCDLVICGFGERIACQAKRWSGPVDNSAVQEAVSAVRHRGCSRAMVITNSYFNKSAKELALSNRCRLIDRDQLALMAADFRDGTRTVKF